MFAVQSPQSSSFQPKIHLQKQEGLFQPRPNQFRPVPQARTSNLRLKSSAKEMRNGVSEGKAARLPLVLDATNFSRKISAHKLVDILKEKGATQPFTGVLIWNTGMSGARLGLGVESFSQKHTGDPKALHLIRACSEDDKQAGYRNQNNTDDTIFIKGASAQETYLNLDQFRQALREAKRLIAQHHGEAGQLAVAVGWGYVSENSEARRIADEEGVIFIGPPAQAIADLGDKAKAKELAKNAGVPTIPGSLGVLGETKDGRIDREKGLQEAKKLADEMGYPVLLKARSGGGGKGIRVVESAEKMKAQFESASSEAESSFGDAGLLLEKYLQNNRHIEFQFIADAYGKVAMLGERDCTLQNKHQKVIESSVDERHTPLDSRLRVREAVAQLVKDSGYKNAGTAEFLYDEKEDKYYFLEINTRLQVEHIVTEQDWGVDLTELQQGVAMGIPLNKLFSSEQLAQFATEDHPGKHTLAVRITAEDGWTGQGSTGTITSMKFPQNIPGLRFYTSVETGSQITGKGDKQIGHIFVTAENREKAINNMLSALSQLSIEGVNTNIGFVQSLLRSEDFQKNNIHTKYLEQTYIPTGRQKPPENPSVALMARAIKLYEEENGRQLELFSRAIATESPLPQIRRSIPVVVNCNGNRYELTISNDASNPARYWVNGQPVERIPGKGEQETLVIGQGADRQSFHIRQNASDKTVSVDHASPMEFIDNDPTRYEARSGGKLVKMHVKPGDTVKAGDPLYDVEVMKQGTTQKAKHDGKVLAVTTAAVGGTLEKGALIVHFEPAGNVKVEPGPRIDLPETDYVSMDLKTLAQRLISGESIEKDKINAALKNAKPEDLFKAVDVFYEQEKRFSSLNPEESQKNIDYQLSRAGRKEQAEFLTRVNALIGDQALKALSVEQRSRLALASQFLKEKFDASGVKSSLKTQSALDPKRAQQAKRSQTYVYDYPSILSSELQKLGAKGPVKMQELTLKDPNDENSGLIPCDQSDPKKGGVNKTSVVIWEAEVPFESGTRRVVWGANDTTIANGSMGYQDSLLYTAAARKAVQEGKPFVFCFSGSGARMLPNLKVGNLAVFNPVDPDDTNLYLHARDYEAGGKGGELLRQQVIVDDKPKEIDGQKYYLLNGVHAPANQGSLSGSAKVIAASIDASNAPNTPTLGISVGPTAVGVQTYAYDMLDNTIQEKKNALLLTGKDPINNGIGQNVYTENLQLGGPRVHAYSGVTNSMAADFKDAVSQGLQWLKNQNPADMNPTLELKARKLPEERVQALKGKFVDWDVEKRLKTSQSGELSEAKPREVLKAVFDDDSFQETQKEYAPNVIVGDARIGNIPVGVIGFETETTKTTRAPDPALPKTPDERTNQLAGRVWDAAGAEKTARFIRSTNWQGKPLVLVPNIRGFKGDTSALLDGVIKHGSQIARELRQFKQPVVVWLPPHAQLRGGAWVVIDPNINPDKITFLADKKSTLGVLEPDMLLTLPKVKSEIANDTQRFKAQLGNADLAAKKATQKWRQVATLADSPEVAVKDSAVHKAIDTSSARKEIFEAILAGMK